MATMGIMGMAATVGIIKAPEQSVDTPPENKQW
jgi:hypothetical protein